MEVAVTGAGKLILQLAGAVLVGFFGVLGLSHVGASGLVPLPVPLPGCLIKGNISINTGRHLYHLPGGRDYDATIISPRYGERWFCSVAEAEAAGWEAAAD